MVLVAAAPASAHEASEAAGEPAWVGIGPRTVYYAGVSGLIGLAFVALFVFRPAPDRILRWGLWTCWAVALFGAVGLAISDGSTDRLGALARLAPLLEAALAIGVALAWRGRSRRLALAGVAAYAALSIFADVRAGHGSAVRSWAWLHVAVLWTHFFAVGLWIGGLAAVIAFLPGTDPEERAAGLARYARVAAVALFSVAFTGVVEAATEVHTWRALASSSFGRVVVAKASVIVVLGVLGAVNRYRHLPRVARSAAPLRRLAAIEVGLAAFALMAAAVLPGLSPAPGPDRIGRLAPSVPTSPARAG